MSSPAIAVVCRKVADCQKALDDAVLELRSLLAGPPPPVVEPPAPAPPVVVPRDPSPVEPPQTSHYPRRGHRGTRAMLNKGTRGEPVAGKSKGKIHERYLAKRKKAGGGSDLWSSIRLFLSMHAQKEFTAKEVANKVGVRRAIAAIALATLAKRGEIRRTGRGLYASKPGAPLPKSEVEVIEASRLAAAQSAAFQQGQDAAFRKDNVNPYGDKDAVLAKAWNDGFETPLGTAPAPT